MKAAVWHGPRDIRVEEYPDPPEPQAGEIQVAIHYSGICGTDVHEYVAGPVFIPWDKPHPLTGHVGPTILGHEMCGRVVKVGPGVSEFSVGDLVAPDIVLYCGKCEMCRKGMYVLCEIGGSLGLQTAQGGFGELVNMPTYTAHKLPPDFPPHIGAMIEPLATATRALRQGRIVAGDSVAIIGAGAIGLFAMQAANYFGARELYMLYRGEKKKDVIESLKPTVAIDTAKVDGYERVMELTKGRGVDVVLECVGAESTVNLAFKIAARQGRISIPGIFGGDVKIDLNQLVFFEKEAYGSLGRSGRDFELAIRWLSEGKIKAEPLISKIVSLNDIVSQGFEKIVQARDDFIKVLVKVR
jgi:(R,R)-butanediol dehydrogenase/meso-butanediol dehydrogenase/diacetyl reductase